MNDPEIERQAADFWTDTDMGHLFPRPIEQAIALKLPVTVVKLPVVSVRAVAEYLHQRRHRADFPSYSRDLMGCLYADNGNGFIFVCGADEGREQRFTLAHDTAHFLVDYWEPRRRVIAAMGPDVIDVLDGKRAAFPAEKAAAILNRIRIGPHWHLLPRGNNNPESDSRISQVENRADDLGLELVAPLHRISHCLRSLSPREREKTDTACECLGDFFDLPAHVFRDVVMSINGPRTLSFLDEARRLLGRPS